jgi:hypothetical protein
MTAEEPTFVHPKDRRKGLLGMIQGTIAVIEDTYTVPKLGVFLNARISYKRDGQYGALTLGFGSR